jgi:hypothetical protein
VVDNAVRRLQPWCAKLMNRGGRAILVQTTLSAMLVHALMSLDIPPETLTAFTKICRAFLWKGRREVNGGHCLVAWDEVTTPKSVGGLGLPNLRLLNLALCCRWAWLQWTDPTKAWAEFDLKLLYLWRSLRRPRWSGWVMASETDGWTAPGWRRLPPT